MQAWQVVQHGDPASALKLVELDPPVGFPYAVVEKGQLADLFDVVLVLDVPYDFFDDVLDRDEALGASELVDDDGEMDALRPHPREEVDDAHRFGDEQRFTQQCRDGPVARRILLGDLAAMKHARKEAELQAQDGKVLKDGSEAV